MKNIILAVFLLLQGYCFAADLEICSIQDTDCQMTNFLKFVNYIGPKGIPGVLKPFMPLDLNNLEATALGYLKLKLLDGVAQGLGTCFLNKFETNWDTLRRNGDIQCTRVVVQGTYEISSDPNFSFLLGDVNGSGNGSITFEDWFITVDHSFVLSKDDKGQIFLLPQFEDATWESKVGKQVTVTADNIEVNGQNVSESVLKYINENWEIVLDTFASFINKISKDIFFATFDKIYNNVPISGFYKEDLTQFIKNDQECNQ